MASIFTSLSDNHWTPLSEDSKKIELCISCDRLHTRAMMIQLDTTKKNFLCIKCHNRSNNEFSRNK
jgi:hypothetical protein